MLQWSMLHYFTDVLVVVTLFNVDVALLNVALVTVALCSCTTI